MNTTPDPLRNNVRFLGELLGNTLQQLEGPEVFNIVETIRQLSKTTALTEESNAEELITYLSELEDQHILPTVRSFNQFLNLANIADQDWMAQVASTDDNMLEALLKTYAEERGKESVYSNVMKLQIELVLTAHPTEVARRTLIQKYDKIANALSDLRRDDLLPHEIDKLKLGLHRVIQEVWSTNEIRNERPTAQDEAKWGFAVVENSLWQSIPDFIRHLDGISRRSLGQGLPLDFTPFKLYSWMGGDRDGNPNVTHDVTKDVIYQGRLMAAQFYLKDLSALGGELSMKAASEALKAHIPEGEATPYRYVIAQLKHKLNNTIAYLEARQQGEILRNNGDMINTTEDLLQPLMLCFESLTETGLDKVANGPLTDIIRRIHCFSINLVPLDIRQDADRHIEVLDELTNYLDMGSYREWDEPTRQQFLLEQLSGKRPLFPRSWPVSKESREVLDTCAVVAEQPQESLSHYVISMAQQPSDVLAVALLLKENGITWSMPVVPLFETLDDLDRAPKVMRQLWDIPWYQEYTSRYQCVMIGYSDSAKDAGKLAATWAQYKAQESLVELASNAQVDLVLFHGRGGTVGRGGGPVEKAIASQPPHSVKGRIRVTEQGEMIRYKFGLPRIAFLSLSTYVSATMKATMSPPDAPKKEWRELIETMAEQSLQGYRSIVREHPDFVTYFRSLTPEQELSKLALGSRPAKRKATGGVESLRAIPWVFAWMQVRLNLPAWLGVFRAFKLTSEQQPALLQDMMRDWPFFSSFVDLIEMVLGKADINICHFYEQQLVPEEVRGLGQLLRKELNDLQALFIELKDQKALLDDFPELQNSLKFRKPYIDPLNYLQAELLKRERKAGNISPELERALMVTMAGISAGMRNTG